MDVFLPLPQIPLGNEGVAPIATIIKALLYV